MLDGFALSQDDFWYSLSPGTLQIRPYEIPFTP
jgi:hypothetical protein